MDIIIRNVRLSFPDLFFPVEFKKGDGKPRWNASFLVKPGSEADKSIRAAIEAEAKNEWGAKAADMLKSMEGQTNKHCYLSGDTKSYDGYAGMMVLASHRAAKLKSGAPNTPPIVLDSIAGADGKPARLTAESGRPYGGCYVDARVSIYCQKGENPGVRSSFSVVQYVGKGEAFSASTPTDEGFEAITEGADAGDLT
jgi:hypothetical protein